MARKRGGLAGLYDRNKAVFRTAVPAALSFIPGVGIPLAAAAGAAMGADTAGKNYWQGFDVGGALKGGIQGASIGGGTQGLRAMLTGGGPMAGMMARTPNVSPMIDQANQQIAQSGMLDLTAPMTGAAGAPTGAGAGTGSALRSLLTPTRTPNVGGAAGMSPMAPVPNAAPMSFRSAMKQPQVLAGAVQGGLGMLPNAQVGQQNAIAQGQLDLNQQKFEEEKRQAEMERKRREQIAQLLMPYLQQSFPQLYGGR